MNRIKRIALLVAALAGSQTLYAQSTHLRLGAPEVQSSLGNPLWVRIPIDVTNTAEEVSATRFSLGSRPGNAAIPFLEAGEVTFERAGSQYYMVIRSRQSVDEPAIGLVIREQLPNGVRSREFIVLLDPPPLANARDVRAGNAAAPQTLQAIPATPVAVTAPPAQPPGSQTPTTATPAVTVEMPTAKAREARGKSRTARAQPAIASVFPLPAAPSTISKVDRRGPKLSLTLNTDTLNRTPATEAERAALRERQLLMDVDDLTAALLDRHQKISRLEKELGDLTARVAAAEKFMNARGAAIGQPAPAATVQATEVAAPVVTEATATTPTAPGGVPAVQPRPVAADITPSVAMPTWSTGKLVLIGGALAALLAAAWFAIQRRSHRENEDAFQIVRQRADEYAAEVLSAKTVRTPAKAAEAGFDKTVEMRAPAVHKPAVPTQPEPSPAVPEIHFELPATPSHLLEANAGAQSSAGIDFDLSTPAANAEHITPPEDLRSRRMRYLQSRYQDIAILKPALDAPARLLRQAATLYGEGAADFAKRLLKYAAYSRPHAEEFWLALLELLYREQFANDYVVNAKWYRQYHGKSKQWDEVQRIGYMLDATEPSFAGAAAWSHEAPVAGTWLPASQQAAKPIAGSLSHLTLELAN